MYVVFGPSPMRVIGQTPVLLGLMNFFFLVSGDIVLEELEVVEVCKFSYGLAVRTHALLDVGLEVSCDVIVEEACEGETRGQRDVRNTSVYGPVDDGVFQTYSLHREFNLCAQLARELTTGHPEEIINLAKDVGDDFVWQPLLKWLHLDWRAFRTMAMPSEHSLETKHRIVLHERDDRPS